MKNRWNNINTLRIGQKVMTAVLVLSPLYLFSQENAEETPQPANTSQYPAFETFESILDKNIFNPNRRPRREETQPVERTPDPDEIVLTGTIVTEKDRFAFFEDSRSGDITVVSTGKTFLGFDVDAVNTNSVILKKDDKPFEVSMLMAMRKDQDSDWEVSTPTNVKRGSSSSSSSSRSSVSGSRNEDSSRSSVAPSASESPSSESSGSGDVQNEVLRKLLEKRKQEAGQ
jgi:hypothetical protein